MDSSSKTSGSRLVVCDQSVMTELSGTIVISNATDVDSADGKVDLTTGLIADRTNVLSHQQEKQQLACLYDRYNAQCKEVERLEKQDFEYREHLLKTVSDRKLDEETLLSSHNELNSKIDGMERQLLETEYQLKVAKDRSLAREMYHSRQVNEVNAKASEQLEQMRKKLERCEKEKNDAVVKYAQRESEVLRLNTGTEKLNAQINSLHSEIEALKCSVEHSRLQSLDSSLNEQMSLIDRERKLRNELKDELDLTLKRIETNQITINELKQNVEKLKKQVSLEVAEKNAIKDEHKILLNKFNALERKREEAEQSAKKTNNDIEELYQNALQSAQQLRERNSALMTELENGNNEKARLLHEYKEMTEKLELLMVQDKNCENKLHELENIESEAICNAKRAYQAEQIAVDAVSDKQQAELEADECRKQAERMLEITQQLSEKNSLLMSQAKNFRKEIFELKANLLESETRLDKANVRLEAVENDYELNRVSFSAEIGNLKSSLGEKTDQVEKLNRQLDETLNEKEVIKRKNVSALKELRAELQYLKKKHYDTSQHKMENEHLSPNISQKDEIPSSEASSIASVEHCRTNSSQHSQVSFEENAGSLQQQMVEKIVKLQRLLARKQDKIDFLEEHVQQCTEELRKKTKIIQNYLLREEASLLLPEDELSKLPIRKNVGIPMFGGMFSNGDKKSELELALEVNSRLQAILEDTLHKNINLKNNIDLLGEEISRLSRENRHRALASSS